MKVWLAIAAGLAVAGAADAQEARFSVAAFSVAPPPGWHGTPLPEYAFVEFRNLRGDNGRVFVTTRDRYGTLDEDVARDHDLAAGQRPKFVSRVTQVPVAGADCRTFTTVFGVRRTDRIYCALGVPDGVDRKPVTFMITSEGTQGTFAARADALARLIKSVRWGRAVDW